MKRTVVFLLASVIGLTVLCGADEKKDDSGKGSSKTKTTQISGITTIEDLTPGKIEELKNENISFETTFKHIVGEFPDYLTKNGKKEEKYFMLRVAPENLTVLCKKKSDLDDLIMSLKQFDKILITGKIKKFTFVPTYRKSRAYYLEVEKIELVKKAEEDIEAKEKYLKKKLKELENRKKQNSMKQ